MSQTIITVILKMNLLMLWKVFSFKVLWMAKDKKGQVEAARIDCGSIASQ